jgi:hypothetical protein
MAMKISSRPPASSSQPDRAIGQSGLKIEELSLKGTKIPAGGCSPAAASFDSLRDQNVASALIKA